MFKSFRLAVTLATLLGAAPLLAACHTTAGRLLELAAKVRSDATDHDLEALERTLTVLEEKLFAALKAAAPEDLLSGIKEHAARELAPSRARMGVVQLRQVQEQFERKQLLVYYSLPRLSLFYMSQQ